MSKRKYNKLTQDRIDKICEDIKLGMSLKEACDVQGCDNSILGKHIKADPAKRDGKRYWPNVAAQVAQARGECIRYWLKRLREATKTAHYKSAQIMLGAMNPARYRERRYEPKGSGITVNILTSPQDNQQRAKVVSVKPESAGELESGEDSD